MPLNIFIYTSALKSTFLDANTPPMFTSLRDWIRLDPYHNLKLVILNSLPSWISYHCAHTQ